MAFLHAALLGLLVAVAAPIIIHLIFRLRKKRVVFSSLRFLRESLVRNARRFERRELLLLLLRGLVVALVALAFARPYLTGRESRGAPTGRTDLVVLLDDSLSMAWREAGLARFDLAREAAERRIRALEPGDRVALVRLSDPLDAENLGFTENFGAALARLKLLRRSWTAARLGPAVERARELLRGSTAERRILFCAADLQATSWAGRAPPRGEAPGVAYEFAALGGAATSPAPAAGPPHPGPSSPSARTAPPSPAGRGGESGINESARGLAAPPRLDSPNLAVLDVRFPATIWPGASRSLPVAVSLANFGEKPATGVGVRLVVGGAKLASTQVSLAPRERRTVRLEPVFPRPGEYAGQVELDPRDGLPEDDRRAFAVELREAVRVLCVEDESGDRPGAGELYFVRAALDPASLLGGAPPSWLREEEAAGGAGGTAGATGRFRVARALPAELSAARLAGADLVVLGGVARLTEEAVAALEAFVARGGGLVLFTGGAVGGEALALGMSEKAPLDRPLDLAFYNERLWRGGRGLLPARLAPARGELGRPELARHLERIEAREGTPFAPFRGELVAALERPSFFRVLGVPPEDLERLRAPAATPHAPASGASGATSAPQVLAWFGPGEPAVVAGGYGKGRVVLWLTSPGGAWSDLPRRRVFAPVVLGLAGYLAPQGGTGAERELLVGAPLDLDFAAGRLAAALAAQADPTEPEPTAPPALTLTPPETEAEAGATGSAEGEGGATGAAAAEPQPLVTGEVVRARAAGLYQVTARRGTREARLYFAANAAPEESDLAPGDPAELERFLGLAGSSAAARPTGTAATGAPGATPAGASTGADSSAPPPARSAEELRRRAPLWRYLVAAALLLLVAEALVGNVLFRPK